MSGLNADEILTQKHKRNFIQYGGARPNNPAKYAGQDAQYMFLDGVTAPESGGIDPVFVPDPRRAGKYKLVGRSITAPDLASATLVMLEKHGALPRQLQQQTCPMTIYELSGQCSDLADFLRGWTDYVLVYSNAEVTDKDLGTRTARDSDDPIEDSLSITLADIYPVGALGFGAEAGAEIDREVIDVTYGTSISCQCGDNTQNIYAVVASSGGGSPGLPAELIYSNDGGITWTQTNITGFGATESPLAVGVVGQYLVVVGDGAYFYAEINSKTGVPGAFTKVSTGFATDPTDMWVSNPREVWFSGIGGYIYKSTDITAGVVVADSGTVFTDLTRIHGIDETIVTVGASGVVLVSTNRGITWAAATTSPTASNLQAVAVLDTDRWWVGSAAGNAYYTLTGGETWSSAVAFPGYGSGQVRDIVFVNDEVGYIAHDTTVPAGRLISTWDGGRDWTLTDPRIVNFPVVDRVNRIACPDAHASIAANNVALACLAGDGTDGTLLLGIASRI